MPHKYCAIEVRNVGFQANATIGSGPQPRLIAGVAMTRLCRGDHARLQFFGDRCCRASQVLAIWAIYLIVRRGYNREVADLEAQVATLNKRLQTLGQQPTGVPTGLLLLMLLAMAFVLSWIVLFPPRSSPPVVKDPPPRKSEQEPANQQQTLQIVRERRNYYQCCCPPYDSYYRHYDYYW